MKRDVTFIWPLLRSTGRCVFCVFIAWPAVMVSVWLMGTALFTDHGVQGVVMQFHILQAQQYQDAPPGVVLRCNFASERDFPQAPLAECEREPLPLPLAAEQDAQFLIKVWSALILLSACLFMLNAWAQWVKRRCHERYAVYLADEDRAVVR